MPEIAPGWELQVERGPQWLLAKLSSPHPDTSDTPPLAERLWALLQEQGIDRLVLELDQVPVLYSYLVGQLVLLHKRLTAGGGMMRLCGLSPGNWEVLHLCRLDDRFPRYRSREEAIRGQYNAQPC